MNLAEIKEIADSLYQEEDKDTTEVQKDAFVKGYLAGMEAHFNKIGDEFYSELAKKLINLFPAGLKDNKYPWRGSEQLIVKRLKFLWKEYDLGTKYSISNCLCAARRYISQFENNTKYMQTLKYFIFKQEKIISKDGSISYSYKSTLLNYLEEQKELGLTDAAEAAINAIDTCQCMEELV